MRLKVLIAVLLIGVSVVLGATVLREPIAVAASPFQNVIVGNTADNPMPVQQQGTVKTSAADNPALQPVERVSRSVKLLT